MSTVPDPPPGLGPAGQALWDSIAGPFELAKHEELLLIEACRTADVLDALDQRIHAEGVVTDDGHVSHAVVESRLSRLALARLVATLRVPIDNEPVTSPVKRQQLRAGARGAYGLRSVPTVPSS